MIQIGNCMLSKVRACCWISVVLVTKLFGRFILYRQKYFFFILKNFIRKIHYYILGILVGFWEQIWQICILLKKIDHSQFSLFSTVDFAKLLCSFFFGGLIFVLYCFPNWCLAAVKNKGTLKRFAQTWKLFLMLLSNKLN